MPLETEIIFTPKKLTELEKNCAKKAIQVIHFSANQECKTQTTTIEQLSATKNRR